MKGFDFVPSSRTVRTTVKWFFSWSVNFTGTEVASLKMKCSAGFHTKVGAPWDPPQLEFPKLLTVTFYNVKIIANDDKAIL